jgi:hypothetical protein
VYLKVDHQHSRKMEQLSFVRPRGQARGAALKRDVSPGHHWAMCDDEDRYWWFIEAQRTWKSLTLLHMDDFPRPEGVHDIEKGV